MLALLIYCEMRGNIGIVFIFAACNYRPGATLFICLGRRCAWADKVEKTCFENIQKKAYPKRVTRNDVFTLHGIRSVDQYINPE